MKLLSFLTAVGASLSAGVLLAGPAVASPAQPPSHPRQNRGHVRAAGQVFTETNTKHNAVLAFNRAPNGRLHRIGRFATGGAGSGALVSSAGTVTLTANHRDLLVSNLGDNTVSVFRVGRRGLRLTDRVRSGGAYPNSIAVRDGLVYVLNNGLTNPNGTGNVRGFMLHANHLVRIPGVSQSLSKSTFTTAAQVGFSPDGETLVVTEEGTDTIDTYQVQSGGQLSAPTAHHSAGPTPFGFAFTRAGDLVVSEADHGTIGAASASSYHLAPGGRLTTLTPALADTQSEVCWVQITNDQRFAFVSNFGSSTISSYAIGAGGKLSLRHAIAGQTEHGDTVRVGLRDEALSADSRYLYAMDIETRNVRGWKINRHTGGLRPLGAFGPISRSLAGMAAY